MSILKVHLEPIALILV